MPDLSDYDAFILSEQDELFLGAVYGCLKETTRVFVVGGNFAYTLPNTTVCRTFSEAYDHLVDKKDFILKTLCLYIYQLTQKDNVTIDFSRLKNLNVGLEQTDAGIELTFIRRL